MSGRDYYTADDTCEIVTCEPGYSLSNGQCITCPAGSVCNPDIGTKTCSELTNGQYTMSDAGISDPAYCYANCALPTNATSVSGRDYYTADDTCAIVTCEPGYSLSNDQCVTCPAGSYCDGTPGDDGDGTELCSDLGDGNWMYSAPGSTNANDCYRTCVQHEEVSCTLTPVEGTAYWANDCQYVITSATDNPAEIVDGVCVETACKNTFEMINGVCQLCNREHALSYKPDGNCIVETCADGFHPNVDQCEEDVRECTDQSPNATYAEQRWDAERGAFGVCMIKSCNGDYHLASNACIADDQLCHIDNGVGMRTWNASTNSWNPCTATSCVPGYTNDPAEKNNVAEQCSKCRNYFGANGEVAVSSYVSGCEIASCMYQGEKYNLENNECVLICDTVPCPIGNLANVNIPAAAYKDETGWMCWDAVTNKCVRTCTPGYTSW